MARPIGCILNFLSYFNPISAKHHALADFKQLKQKHKITTLALSFLSAIATLPLLGLGGVATFRSMTRKFKALSLNQGNARVDAVNDLYVKVMIEHLKSKQNVVRVQELGPKNQTTQDPFFIVMAKALNIIPEAYLKEFKNFVASKTEGVKEIFENDGFFDPAQRALLSFEQFEKLLISSNIPHEAKKIGISPCVELQIALNKCRAQLTVAMKNVSITVHEVSEMHIDVENKEPQVSDENFIVYPEVSSAIKVEKEKIGQSHKFDYTPANPTRQIVMAHGRVFHTKDTLLPDSKQIYIQPQIVLLA